MDLSYENATAVNHQPRGSTNQPGLKSSDKELKVHHILEYCISFLSFFYFMGQFRVEIGVHYL